MMMVTKMLYPKYNQLNSPTPVKAYLKVSRMAVSGLATSTQMYFGYVSFMTERGYITGVAYIQSCTPKVIKKRKSRYFVVIDEIIIPNPNPKHPSITMRIGANRIVALIWKGTPEAK